MIIDKKKVIKGLKECSIDDVDCKHCPYNGEGNQKYGCKTVMQREALKLLKEQPEIVRCRECKYGEKVNSVYLCGKTRGFGLSHAPDWYCADGEKNDE